MPNLHPLIERWPAGDDGAIAAVSICLSPELGVQGDGRTYRAVRDGTPCNVQSTHNGNVFGWPVPAPSWPVLARP
ncbi:hypothetical protein FJTKL_03858 [Diaporthe vaccinii]|uniref:Uncharacterized protein n=1 Tax=Diaporthe vaccinii TaxID=105482 RepID=A0ABR4F1B4_9PEZI